MYVQVIHLYVIQGIRQLQVVVALVQLKRDRLHAAFALPEISCMHALTKQPLRSVFAMVCHIMSHFPIAQRALSAI